MQYVRSISGSVSKTWNSINPATLSGAIDVIVVELDDGTLACSPFHVRFGKFSLLRPSEKKVEFRVNNVRQDYAMKLGEGGEAFFVFETMANVPEGLQTSPLVSPVTSPSTGPASESGSVPGLTADPEPLELDTSGSSIDDTAADPVNVPGTSVTQDVGIPTLSKSYTDLPPNLEDSRDPLNSRDLLGRNNASLGIDIANSRPRGSSQPPTLEISQQVSQGLQESNALDNGQKSEHSTSPLLVPRHQAISRAMTLSKKLSISNIPSHVNDDGDLMLDMTGFKSSEEEALRAEVLARQILAEELEGNYDIGSLIGADEKGNLWIYSSEEAKAAAAKKAAFQTYSQEAMSSTGALSDPGYHSDDAQSSKSVDITSGRNRADSDVSLSSTPPTSPTLSSPVEPIRSYAKTLRLTSEQLKAMNLKHGANPISFSVNRATCTANIYLWTHQTPIVISDIDGTITKSDALGHVLNMIGRDWTHLGVAKLYSDIVANGYNILYLTSRSVGQADTTRTYISGINQDGYKLPRGPVIMSPDRTIAALRREIYLRKPEVFKMACLRDIMSLFPGRQTPFYAGFGNRLTDALSYRAVNIPSTRIFTINSNAEVSLDLLSLNKYKTAYTSMRETVDQFFPPIGTLVQDGGDDFTDFNYWRDAPVEIDDLSATDSDVDEDEYPRRSFRSLRSEDEGSDVMSDELAESFMSRNSLEESMTLRRRRTTEYSDDDENDDDF